MRDRYLGSIAGSDIVADLISISAQTSRIYNNMPLVWM